MTKEDARRRAIERRLARMDVDARDGAVGTGFAALDSALGVSGFPRGTVVEIFGPPDSGKTTLALRIAAHAQRNGFGAAWVDADGAFDPGYAAALGIAIERMPVVRPESAEQAMTMIHRLAATGALDVIFVDSAAALIPNLELAAAIGDQSPGLQGRVLASSLQTVARVIANAGVVLVFVNQTRLRKGRTGESWETSAGGSALQLHASIRIELSVPDSGHACFRIVKNKAGSAFGTGELVLSPAGFVKSL